MLEDFKEHSFYNYAKNIKKYFHAYLFEVNDLDSSYPLILAFAKTILCKDHYTNNDKCNECNKCLLIDKGYNSDLIVIEPINSMIKKEQVLDLKNKFSLKSSDENNRVYIIKQAECMNVSAANSLLKFIEEPEVGIYGILITTNKNQILKTIISRCIPISLTVTINHEIKIDDIIKIGEILNITSFLNDLILRKNEELPYIKKDFRCIYSTREQILNAFYNLELILEYIIKCNYNKELLSKEMYDIISKVIQTNLGIFDLNSIIKISNYFIELYIIILKIIDKASLDNLILMLDTIVKYRNKLLNVINMNLDLFMDRFIIDVSEVFK